LLSACLGWAARFWFPPRNSEFWSKSRRYDTASTGLPREKENLLSVSRRRRCPTSMR
jgi:hypothetical protein